ncbi:MAG: methionine aminopeptidase [Candidatus Adiutrix intracellularis]|jgi:methionyl aminopeptidase|nr:MAG: methionine aminopeptidase [Candidatus Adiutrix intracellularis]MDR2827573.1 type I methionyl aminopeptidase [Candidatus Adiutrix intracellularis]
MIYIKNNEEIELIRQSGRLAARTLNFAASELKPGVTTSFIDKLIHDFIRDHGATPATLGYRNYPASSCISINEVVVHGIPGSNVVHEGDLVKIDVTTILDGYFGDTTRSFLMDGASLKARALVEATEKAMHLGIQEIRNGARLGNIGAAIQNYVEPLGYSVVRYFVGHGVGREFHEDPSVPHFGKRGVGLRLKTGMVLTVEPMINEGVSGVKILKDNWTAITADSQLSAQFEHTVAVTPMGYDILTLSD